MSIQWKEKKWEYPESIQVLISKIGAGFFHQSRQVVHSIRRFGRRRRGGEKSQMDG